MKVAWSEYYAHPLPENHRFPMIKYDLLREQLIFEGTVDQKDFFSPESVTPEIVTWTHDAEYLRKLLDGDLTREEIRRTGFPYSQKLIDRELNIAGGTVQCAVYSLENGVSLNVAGGTHHAFYDRGEGFCLLNDLAIAANFLKRIHGINKILIVDLDVHQGNGTAEIFKNDPSVFTFSMHGEKNYPIKKEQSDLDIELPDGSKDEDYLPLLKSSLDKIFESFQPEFVFYQSGVDVLATDKLGRLSLSIDGCNTRDAYVIERCKSLDVPLVICMGGGYSPSIRTIVEAHANTFRTVNSIYF